MFIDNKYTKWYFNIIKSAKNRKLDGYAERHHIIPKSLGGNNSEDNLVPLTAREHFICHRLLTKMTIGKHKRKMDHALGRFVQLNGNVNRDLTSRQYNIARESIINARKGTTFSKESRKKMSEAAKGRIPWNKGLSGIQQYSEENKEKLSEMYSGRSFVERHGLDKAEKIKQKISESKLGKPSGMLGKEQSVETKKKISKAQLGIKKGPQKRHRCHHCNEDGKTARHIKYCSKN